MRNRRAWRGVCVVVAAVAASIPEGRPAAQQAAFRASTEAIYVTATAIDSEGKLVTDLTQEDFEVRDNGEVRPITVFSRDRVPFAMSVMFDMSGSLAGEADRVRAAVAELTRHFEPGDRVNIGAFAMLSVVSPYFSGSEKTILNWVAGLSVTHGAKGRSLTGTPAVWMGNGVPCFVPHPRAALYPFAGSAIWDAVRCGINTVYADGETPRRVVLIVTDGMENSSASTRESIEHDAAEKGIIVYAIGLRGSDGLDSGALRTLAGRTGGGYFELRGTTDLSSTFARVAEELRRQYVFGFARAPAADKRHALEVRVLRPGVKARARQVYVEPVLVNAVAGTGAIASSTPAALPVGPAFETRPSAPAVAPRSALGAALQQYRPGVSKPLPLPRTALWSGAADFRRDALVWINDGGPADAARRRLVVATYVLETLVDFESPWLWRATQPASALLEWASKTLSLSPPLPAERAWRIAAMGLVERSALPDVVRHHLEQARERFPSDDQWLLVAATLDELDTAANQRDDGTLDISSGTAARIRRRYEQAAGRESVREEVLARWGAFESRLGRHDDALARLGQAGRPDDPLLRFWLHMWKGRAFERANRLPEAIAAFQDAWVEMPASQSAALAYAAALVNAHRMAEAAPIVKAAVTPDPSALATDPWDLHRMPDARMWPAALSALRRELAP